MKPDWDKLMKKYKDHATILVADVDCTAGGKDLCEKIGVEGFPTIKYGDPNNLEVYEGGRDLKSLKKFAKSDLGPRCGPANTELCDEAQKKQLEGFLAMSEAELDEAIAAKDGELKSAEALFEGLVKGFQEQYEAGEAKKDETKKAIKAGGLGIMKSVHAHRITKAIEKGEL